MKIVITLNKEWEEDAEMVAKDMQVSYDDEIASIKITKDDL